MRHDGDRAERWSHRGTDADPRRRNAQIQAAVDLTVGETARVVVPALRAAQRMSTGEIADLLSTSPPTALKRLRELEDQGLVRWNGKSPKDPRAYWTVRT